MTKIEFLWSNRKFPLFADKMPDVYKRNDIMTSLLNIDNKAMMYLFGYNFECHRLNFDYQEIPIDLIIRRMQRYALPIYSQYVETTENDAFIDISNDFFWSLFWTGTIYVCAEKSDEYSEGYMFRIFHKLIPEDYPHHDHMVKKAQEENEINKFLDLINNEIYIITNWEQDLIKVCWPLGKNNFVDWFEATYKCISDDKEIERVHKLSTKHITCTVAPIGNNPEILFDEADKMTITDRPYLKSALNEDSDEKIRWSSTPHQLTPESAKTFALSRYSMRDRMMYELGRVANLNPKGERLTTGENYKDIQGISDRQRSVLNALLAFSNKVKNWYNIELCFAINTIPENEGLMPESELAPLPSLGE